MMRIKKKLIIASLALAACVMSTGCGATTFPAESELYGVDVSGMDQAQAEEALKQAAVDYHMEVTLDEVTFVLSGEQIGLALSDQADLAAIIKNYNKNNYDLTDQPAVYVCSDTEAVKEALTTAYDAALLQGEESGEAADGTAEESGTDSGTAEESGTDSSAAEDSEVTEGDASGDSLGFGVGTAARENTADTAAGDSAAAGDTAAAEDNAAADTGEDSQELLDPTAAGIVYDETTQTFVGRDGEDGMKPDYATAAEQIANAAATLTPSLTCSSEQVFTEGEKAADSEAVQTALAEANAYLDLELVYEFTPDGQETTTETIGRDQLASLLTIQTDGLTVEVDESALASYVSELAEAHAGKGSSKSKFKTTAGDVIEINVATAGQTVDTQALYDDLKTCMNNKTSGTRTAAYAQMGESADQTDFGGSYCEVDLTNQMVYCYKDGELKVSSPCVTGCVTKGNGTPTGVYSIFDKNKDRYLQGDGYKSWVNFFVPFNGGIGFHDASWRSVFGGSIYLYSGSHGCINMPYDKVKILYENVEIGTKVIVYGGKEVNSGYTQTWTGTTSYTGTVGGGSMKVNLSCRDGAHLSYTSSDPSVATVNSSGVITPVGPGTCTVTVHASATSSYAASSKSVSVTIKGNTASGNNTDASAVSSSTADSKKTDTKTDSNKKKDEKTDSGDTSGPDSKKTDTSAESESTETAGDSKADEAGEGAKTDDSSQSGDSTANGDNTTAGEGTNTGEGAAAGDQNGETAQATAE